MTGMLAHVLLIAGAALLVVAALGVLRLPDALARQHAAAKAGTLAVGVFATGVALAAWEAGWEGFGVRTLLLLLVLAATLPLASHALARASVVEAETLTPPERADPAPPPSPPAPQDG